MKTVYEGLLIIMGFGLGIILTQNPVLVFIGLILVIVSVVLAINIRNQYIIIKKEKEQND